MSKYKEMADRLSDLSADHQRQREALMLEMDAEWEAVCALCATVIASWIAEGYSSLGMSRDGHVYPVTDAEIPRGAVDPYVSLTSPEAERAVAESIADGWGY